MHVPTPYNSPSNIVVLRMKEVTEIQVQSIRDRVYGVVLFEDLWDNGSVTLCPFNNGEDEVNIFDWPIAMSAWGRTRSLINLIR